MILNFQLFTIFLNVKNAFRGNFSKKNEYSRILKNEVAKLKFYS